MKVVLDHELLVGRNAQRSLAELDAHAEAIEHRQDRHEVLRLDAFDDDIPARHRGESDEAADLHVIGADAPSAAA